MTNFGKQTVLGVNIDAVDYEYATQLIVERASQRRPCAVSALAVHGVMTGCRDIAHRRRLNGLDLVVPDGQPVRWALRWLHGVRLRNRVYGPELMARVVEEAAANGLPIYFYGSTAETLGKLLRNLKRRHPALQVAGSEPSKFRRLSAEETEEVAARIVDSGARIVCVGLGCPRQEVWAFEFRRRLSIPILAVGAAFDFHAGTLAQAPVWMQRHGLEWLFRLLVEPRRLWKRYVYLNPAYIGFVAMQAASIHSLAVHLPDGTEPKERFG